MRLIEPEYMQRFVCLADTCPDTCCSGWEIVFDEESCKRYHESNDRELREAFYQNVIRNEKTTVDGSVPFARVKLTKNSSCPYLRTDGLCMIQRRTEEKNLSETCRTHPRIVQFWGDDYVEVSLQLSCPMAVSLVLSDKPIHFSFRAVDLKYFNGLRYNQENSESGIAFRNFLIYILQQRDYPIKKRLQLANHFFWQAGSLSDDSQPTFLAMVDEMLSVLADKKKIDLQYDQRIHQPAIQLEILHRLLQHRIKSIEDKELHDLNHWLFVHWELDDPVTTIASSLYEQDCRVAESLFFTKHGQAIENYLVNQVFKEGNFFFEANGIDKWIFLILQYALQHFLLTAAIIHFDKPYTLEDAQHMVQKMTRIMEHDMSYRQQCLKFIHMLQIDHEIGIALLF